MLQLDQISQNIPWSATDMWVLKTLSESYEINTMPMKSKFSRCNIPQSSTAWFWNDSIAFRTPLFGTGKGSWLQSYLSTGWHETSHHPSWGSASDFRTLTVLHLSLCLRCDSLRSAGIKEVLLVIENFDHGCRLERPSQALKLFAFWDPWP